jgi:SAM-dependent methyltransferase
MATIDAIVGELMELARAGPDLLQFRSRVSAHQYLPLYRLVRRYVKAPATTLDWGAGNGHFSYFLQRSGYRVTGYSMEDFRYESFLPRPEAYRYVQGTLSEPRLLPFSDASFEAVTSIGVLEHVRETGGTEADSLREIGRVLAPGAVFICGHLPNRYSWIEAAVALAADRHRHPFKYTKRQIRRMFRDAGLSVEHLTRYQILPRNIMGLVPETMRRSRALARVWDAADLLAATPLGLFVQNFAVVGRKMTTFGGDPRARLADTGESLPSEATP